MYRTKQEAFDIAYKGLASQEFRRSVAYGRSDQCQYRGSEGRKCAIGHLIPDERYEKSFEGYSILKTIIARAAGIHPCDTFYDQLQNAHDVGCTPDSMKYLLHCVAREFNLTVPSL